MKYLQFSRRLALLAFAVTVSIGVQADDRHERDIQRARSMFPRVWAKIQAESYDPSFGGVNTTELERTATSQLEKTKSLAETYALIAQAVVNLNDSHTRFFPPLRPVRIEYGVSFDVVGKNVYVGAVKPGSDAAKQGLQAGERVLSINGMPAFRDSLDLIEYSILALNPQTGLRLQLARADGATSELTFAAEVKTLPRNLDLAGGDFLRLMLKGEEREAQLTSKFVDLAPKVLWWQLSTFSLPEEVERGLRKASSYDHVIIDLRRNSGGLESEMLDAIGACLGSGRHPIGKIQERTKEKPLVASSRFHIPGKLYVLIDGNSASASEIFARSLQLAGRATVLGDLSAGMVNRSRTHVLTLGDGANLVVFAVQVTEGQVKMSDGQVLEKNGVTPDVWLVPSPKDLAAGDDPVLAAAAKMAGVALTNQQAGEITRKHRPQIFD